MRVRRIFVLTLIVSAFAISTTANAAPFKQAFKLDLTYCAVVPDIDSIIELASNYHGSKVERTEIVAKVSKTIFVLNLSLGSKTANDTSIFARKSNVPKAVVNRLRSDVKKLEKESKKLSNADFKPVSLNPLVKNLAKYLDSRCN